VRELVLTPKFKRAFRQFVRRDAKLKRRIEETLAQMRLDIFAPPLSTHKLSGELAGWQACSCGYDCRIIFSIQFDKETGQEVIILFDIGHHDEVY
jgi:mRNA-degrading endonuclease YafQ of YafQ-DinJ toxin-antitoxin module